MSRDYRVYLYDILEAIERIRCYVSDYNFKQFQNDPKTTDAVIRNLAVMGEAVKNIPGDFRKKYSDIEWRKIAGLRDVLIHGYFIIDLEIIWDIIENKLDNLEAQIKEILDNLDGARE